MADKKPCLLCKKLLEPATSDWDTYQPWGGGEINFVFCYGSLKFDNSMRTTKFRAIICDECAEEYADEMDYSTT